MKILYAIQGTGNGHLARAEDVVPVLRDYGDLDLFVSGAQADIKLPFPVKYTSKGLSFYFGKKGGVDINKTLRKNSVKDIYKAIKQFPVEKYDLVLNDFEPISAWACKNRGVPCVSLSHQSSLLSPLVPKPGKIDPVGHWIIHRYAPAHHHVGFHFQRYDDNIFTPVIRTSIRTRQAQYLNHMTVYLPAYDDRKLLPVLTKLDKVQWHVFSKHAKKAYRVGAVSVFPVNNRLFVDSLTSCLGILCGAGFETPAEALYLKKKLMVIPMQGQLEQHYNAIALEKMGVPVIRKFKKKHLSTIAEWINEPGIVEVDYPDITREAVELALRKGQSITSK